MKRMTVPLPLCGTVVVGHSPSSDPSLDYGAAREGRPGFSDSDVDARAVRLKRRSP